MNAVKNNPYRTLGLFGNSSEKELQKQIATIKRFAEVGKAKAFDYDFPFLGDVVRSTDKVQEAASRIEQAKNKVHYALFWFLNSSHIDEAALNNLKEGNIEKAAEIWEKTLKDTQVTSKNFTSISNLSTLQLGIVTTNGSFDSKKFTASIELKGKLMLSEVFNNFITSVIGEGLSINKEVIIKDFADEVLQIVKPYLNKSKGINSSQLINAFNSFPTEIKQYISGKFIDRPISNIEGLIEKTKQNRNDNTWDADDYGVELYEKTKEDLAFLQKVLGSNNVQYQMIVNKLANEILQCAIDYFNDLQGNEELDPGETSMSLLKLAKTINPTGQTKSRLDENIENLQDWIDDTETRKKELKVKKEIDFISSIIFPKDKQKKEVPIPRISIEILREAETLLEERLHKIINEAVNIKNKCLPSLTNIKYIIGVENELYLELSSSVVQKIISKLVYVVNEGQKGYSSFQNADEYVLQLYNHYKYQDSRLSEMFPHPRGYRKGFSVAKANNILPFEELASLIDSAYNEFLKLENIDMLEIVKEQWKKNFEIITSIKNQIDSISERNKPKLHKNTSKDGCYIATMVYGSYEHPQVFVLREYRDNILSKTTLGRGFIKTYYKYSPKLVEHLKNKPLLNQIIKSILNTLIRIIK